MSVAGECAAFMEARALSGAILFSAGALVLELAIFWWEALIVAHWQLKSFPSATISDLKYTVIVSVIAHPMLESCICHHRVYCFYVTIQSGFFV